MIDRIRSALGGALGRLFVPRRSFAAERGREREVIRGSAGNVIIVKSPNTEYFKEAIFILCDDLFTRRGVSSAQILREARRAAWEYTAAHTPPSSVTLLTRLLYFLLGAAAGLFAAFFLL